MEHNLTAADVSDTDTLGDSDDDGLQSYDLESIDDVYLDGRDGEEEGESQVAELKILHMSGEAKMTRE